MSEFLNSDESNDSKDANIILSSSKKLVSESQGRLLLFALLCSFVSLFLAAFVFISRNETHHGVEKYDDTDLFSAPIDLQGLIAMVEESVVSIECNGWGTGFVLDTPTETEGFLSVIVTNFHVIEDCVDSESEIVVLTRVDQSGQPSLKLVDWDEENDLAIIEVKEEIPGLVAAENYAERGWWTMAMGSPVDTDFETPAVLYNSTTFGNISYVLDDYWNYTSATINGGNSGGPLVNSRGELIGINTLAAASTEAGVWNIAVDSSVLCKKIYRDCVEE